MGWKNIKNILHLIFFSIGTTAILFKKVDLTGVYMKKRQQIIVILIEICFVLLAWFTPVYAFHDQEIHSDKNKEILKPSLLLITKIEDGFGLTVTIENIGNEREYDISLTVSSKNGLFLFIPNKQYQIKSIPAHESHSQKINIFGIGLGQLTDYPMITLKMVSPNFKPMN